MDTIFFVTGPCGVGKTSIVKLLKKSLKGYEIYDFDDVGVPEDPSIHWRRETTKYWLEVGEKNRKKGISTVVCGLVIPEEIEMFLTDTLQGKVYIFLLDVSVIERTRRLTLRNASQELIDDVEEVIGLRKWVPDSNLQGKNVIHTTNISPQEVAERVKKLILQIN